MNSTTHKEHTMSEAFKTWEEMSVLEQMACQYWDMYKDAHGVRPRGIDTSSWSEADFLKEFEYLGKVIDQEEVLRKERESRAEHDFELRVQSLLVTGAKDREMALRWIHEAEGSGGDDEYLCYLVGLPYGYFRKAA
jgi:hypothetical protein